MASTGILRTELDPDKEYLWHNPRHDELVSTRGDQLYIENNKGELKSYYIRGVSSIMGAMGCTLLGEV